MVSSEDASGLVCELEIATETQGQLIFSERRHTGRPMLGPELRRRLRSETDPEEYGTALFKALGEDLIAGYREALALARHEDRRLHLRLNLSPDAPAELHSLHWELLFDPKESLAPARSRSTTLSRYLSVPLKPGSPVIAEPKMLIAIAAPNDLAEYGLAAIDVDEQRKNLEEALRAMEGSVQWEFLDGPITVGRLRDRLVDGGFHFVHLQAHGMIAGGETDAHLVLEDEEQNAHFVSEKTLGEIFEGHADLRLITLMACHGGKASNADPFSGLGRKLVRRGIPAIIAMRSAISLENATCFTKHLYRNLARDGRVDVAVNEARQQLYLESATPRPTLHWAAPSLFLRLEQGTLWQTAEEAPPAADLEERFKEFLRGDLPPPDPKALPPHFNRVKTVSTLLVLGLGVILNFAFYDPEPQKRLYDYSLACAEQWLGGFEPAWKIKSLRPSPGKLDVLLALPADEEVRRQVDVFFQAIAVVPRRRVALSSEDLRSRRKEQILSQDREFPWMVVEADAGLLGVEFSVAYYLSDLRGSPVFEWSQKDDVIDLYLRPLQRCSFLTVLAFVGCFAYVHVYRIRLRRTYEKNERMRTARRFHEKNEIEQARRLAGDGQVAQALAKINQVLQENPGYREAAQLKQLLLDTDPSQLAGPRFELLRNRPGQETVLYLRLLGTPYAYQAPAEAERITVGRQRRKPDGPPDVGNDIVVRVPGSDRASLRISRRHLVIERIDQEYYLQDCSGGRTKINGAQISGERPIRLQSHDRIIVAGVLALEIVLRRPVLRGERSQAIQFQGLDKTLGICRMEVSIGDMVTELEND